MARFGTLEGVREGVQVQSVRVEDGVGYVVVKVIKKEWFLALKFL